MSAMFYLIFFYLCEGSVPGYDYCCNGEKEKGALE